MQGFGNFLKAQLGDVPQDEHVAIPRRQPVEGLAQRAVIQVQPVRRRFPVGDEFDIPNIVGMAFFQAPPHAIARCASVHDDTKQPGLERRPSFELPDVEKKGIIYLTNPYERL